MSTPGPSADLALSCADCAAPFAFTGAEQAFYRERGLREPTRCAPCRATRRAERNAPAIAALDARLAAGAPVVTATDHGTFGGASATGGARFSRGTGSGYGGPRQLFPATCASCGAATEVPFPPRGGRPVYCRECFGRLRRR